MSINPTLAVAIGTALVGLGVWLGTLRSSTKSAHHRIDSMKDDLSREFGMLRETIKAAWRECPLVREGHGKTRRES